MQNTHRFHHSKRRLLLSSAIFLAVSFFGFAFSAMPPDAGKKPVRIVSHTVGNDELLLALAAPEQVAALSHLSTDAKFCAVSDIAKNFPHLPRDGDAESILKHQPTLVLFSDFSRVELVTQVRRAGVRTLVVSRYASLNDTYENLRTIAAAIDTDAKIRAEKIIADAKTRVSFLDEKLRNVKKIRVIAPSTFGQLGGRNTTFQDLCDHVGAENLAATLGNLNGYENPPPEKMLVWDIEKLVVEAGENYDGKNVTAGEIETAIAPFLKFAPYKFMASVKNRQVALIRPWQASCISHHRVLLYEELARQLHPEVFEK